MTTIAEPVKVLIADDHTLFRAGLAHMLATDPRVEVVGQARDGEEAVEQTLARSPDVVLMDVQMPKLDGVEATRRISHDAPHVRVLMLSAFGDNGNVSEAVANGAAGFLNKDATLRDVVATILAPSSVNGAGVTTRPAPLSTRELHVLKHVAIGLSNKQVARRLGISEKTVRNHLTRIFSKLGVVTRTEAVVNAMRAGALAPWFGGQAID